MKAAKVILGRSKRTSNSAVSAELGIQPLRSGRDARKLTWQYRMRGMGEERTTGDIGLRERSQRLRKVDDEDAKIKCDCGSEC
ncbi:unnamed protein product [Ectocarpus sp. CCAP 1310/34]|nr:unnamed protein product [Ectocarpus sp. CCAP 1310/34]